MLRLAFIVVSIAVTLLSSAGYASDRVALVIGNSKYQHTAMLRNPDNDATAMAAALRNLGFDVIEGEDLTGGQFADVVSKFSQKLIGSKVALFYYAGHAMQYEQTNYLMPVDATLKNAFQLKREMIAMSDILDAMESSAPMNLVFLDACRDNPLADELTKTLASQGRAVQQTRGLARISTSGRNTLVAFAAGPGHEAHDGTGDHSPFTASLLRHIATPDVEIETMLKRVTQDVLKETGNQQEPERLSRLTNDFYFKKSPKIDLVDQNQPQQQPSVLPPNSPFTPDALQWSLVKDTINVSLLRAFIERYPQSLFRADAENRLRQLESTQQPQKPVGNMETAAEFLDKLLPRNTSQRYSLTLPQNMRQKVAEGLRRLGYLGDAAADYVKTGADQFALRFAVLKYQQAEGLSQTGYLSRDGAIALLSHDPEIQQLAATQKLLEPDSNKSANNNQRDNTVTPAEDPAEAFKKLSLSRIERLRIARTLELMGLTNDGFPVNFVQQGEADSIFTNEIKAFQRGRGFDVTGYPSSDQVRYLVSLGDKKSSWETKQATDNSEQGLKLGDLTLAQAISRVKLALFLPTSASDAEWRAALKTWQASNGFEANGLISRDVFVRLLDVPVDIPPPNWSTDTQTNDWAYWQNPQDNDKRCYIFTFAKSMTGRYADTEMPDMTMSRVPNWPDGQMSATYVKTRWFDTSKPVSIIIDGTTYELTTREGYYWPRVTGNNQYSNEIMKALAKTVNEVSVIGTSPWGGEMRMVFSAAGFTSIFNRLDSACGRNTLVAWMR